MAVAARRGEREGMEERSGGGLEGRGKFLVRRGVWRVGRSASIACGPLDQGRSVASVECHGCDLCQPSPSVVACGLVLSRRTVLVGGAPQNTCDAGCGAVEHRHIFARAPRCLSLGGRVIGCWNADTLGCFRIRPSRTTELPLGRRAIQRKWLSHIRIHRLV